MNYNIFWEFWLKTMHDVVLNLNYGIGKITQEFHVKLKNDAELRKQRPPKLPLRYKNRVEIHLREPQRAEIIR